MATGPAGGYRSRLDDRRASLPPPRPTRAPFRYMPLTVLAAAVVVIVLAVRSVVPWWALAVPVAVFLALVQRHERVVRARDAAARAISFYERGIGRIEDRWMGTGEPGDRFRDDRHPFANDLDLFG